MKTYTKRENLQGPLDLGLRATVTSVLVLAAGLGPLAADANEAIKAKVGATVCEDCHFGSQNYTGLFPEVKAAYGEQRIPPAPSESLGNAADDGVVAAMKSILGLDAPPGSCGSAKPELDSISASWDAEVGQRLNIPVSAVDCDDDAIAVRATRQPPGASLSAAAIDPVTRKWTATFTWTPAAAQVNKAYAVSFRAAETETVAHQSSKPRKVTIRVWPAGGPESSSVSSVLVSRAQWKAGPGQLLVKGKVILNKLLTPVERQAMLRQSLTLMTNDSTAIGAPVSLKRSGTWSAKLGLSEGEVPCTVVADFSGKKGSRDVKSPPTHCRP